MTERIRELFDRAEHQALKHLGSDWEVYVEPSREQIFEKFAELIVRECIAICISNALDDLDSDDKRGSSAKSAFDIKEYFGVEE